MSATPNNPKPSIDARLEALAQSVQLLLHSQEQTDRQIKRLGRYIRGLALIVFDHESRIDQLEGNDTGEN